MNIFHRLIFALIALWHWLYEAEVEGFSMINLINFFQEFHPHFVPASSAGVKVVVAASASGNSLVPNQDTTERVCYIIILLPGPSPLLHLNPAGKASWLGPWQQNPATGLPDLIRELF